jgi:hypothetical protein
MGDVPAEEGCCTGPEGFGTVSCGPGSLRRGVTCGTTTGGGGGGGVCANRSGAKGNPAKNTASAIMRLRIAKPCLPDTAKTPTFGMQCNSQVARWFPVRLTGNRFATNRRSATEARPLDVLALSWL